MSIVESIFYKFKLDRKNNVKRTQLELDIYLTCANGVHILGDQKENKNWKDCGVIGDIVVLTSAYAFWWIYREKERDIMNWIVSDHEFVFLNKYLPMVVIPTNLIIIIYMDDN